MTDTVDSLLDEHHGGYAERDVEGVTNLCLWPFLAIRRGDAIYLLDPRREQFGFDIPRKA